MVRVIKVVCLCIFFSSCFNVKEDTNKKGLNNKVINATSNKKISQNYFKNLKEFKSFIEGKRWVDVKDEFPCYEDSRSIMMKGNYVYIYTMEPTKCKIESIKQVDSKTLEIKVEKGSSRGNRTLQLEIISLEERLVKWTNYYEETFEAKPYDIICKDWSKEPEKKESYHTSMYNIKNATLSINGKWEGLYYFKGGELDLDYILDFKEGRMQLNVQARQYGYSDQLKAVQLGDTLGLYHHKNISGYNYDEDRAYDFLKFYKSSDGKFYFEGKLPYLPKGAIEFDKVK